MRHWTPEAGTHGAEARPLAEEAPVALLVNGQVHAVMLATPRDLADFALGFALTEGIVDTPAELLDVAEEAAGEAWLCRLTVPEKRAHRLAGRERATAGYGGCGLCGVREIDAVMAPPALVGMGRAPSLPALHAAARDLPRHQRLNRESHAVHAAAFIDPDGAIQAVREDVGRHNALDKLIGHLVRGGGNPTQGAILMTSRCSVELVNKAARIGCPVLATVSLPTDLAVRNARQAGLSLVCLVRDDGLLVVEDRLGRLG
ncbi:MAG: formate dehydrogenase accessory sulfurtransferase FdhD [Azospirillaceae bacterium]